jgi:hypothetical protein
MAPSSIGGEGHRAVNLQRIIYRCTYNKQDRQCTYNVTLRYVRLIIGAVEKQ